MIQSNRNLIITASVAALLLSCTAEGNKNRGVKSIKSELNEEIPVAEKIDRVKKIFYTLPSPLELTLLFKKEGVQYHSDMLHPVAKRKNYNSTKGKALNLGVYGADLSFSGLFGRHEAAIQYYAASQLLAADLGIGSTFQNSFIERLESYPGNKDTLLAVVSQFFIENDNYLKENEEQDLSAYIITGGWVEGMYLGTKIIDEESNAKGIRNIITNQRAPLHNLVVLFQNVRSSDSNSEILALLGEIEAVYRNVEGDLTAEQYDEIKSAIVATREYIVNL